MPAAIRPLRLTGPDADLPWAEELLDSELGGRSQARLGIVVDALAGIGLVADDAAGRPIGLVAWLVGGEDSASDEAEIRVVVVDEIARGRGVGAALLQAAEAALEAAGVTRAWLATTNDNLEALALYQRHGWRLTELHRGAVDVARTTIKPRIPTTGSHAIPLHDELVLRKGLLEPDA